MPDHIQFMLRHAVIGAIAGISFVGLLCYFNVGNIWHLVTHTQGGYLALGVTTVLFIITFSGVQMGVAVMALQEKEPRDPPRGPMVRVSAETKSYTR